MTATVPKPAPPWNEAALRAAIRTQLAGALRCAPDAIDDAKPFEAYGLPSLDAVELTAALEDLVGIPVDAEAAFDHGSVALLATYLHARLRSAEGSPS